VSTAEPLYQAANYGKLDVVRLLVKELDANVSLLHNGFTALCIAAHRGHEHVVRALVQEFGADVNQVTEDGATALYAAAHGVRRSTWGA
jgi:ankyrin repeat protein